MKTKLLFILFFCFAFSTNTFADYGTFFLYKAKFVLKNGEVLTASVPLSNYHYSLDQFKHLDKDRAFQTLLNSYFFKGRNTLEFQVYTQLHTLRLPDASLDAFASEFWFTDSASVQTLHLDSIRYTVLFRVEEASSLMWRQVELFDSDTVEKLGALDRHRHLEQNLYTNPNYFLTAHFFCVDNELSETEFMARIQNFGSRIGGENRAEPSAYLEEVRVLLKEGVVLFFWGEGGA
ncbi:MAG: hypothetical protein R2792_01680 [Saprospiraceae bacterium]